MKHLRHLYTALLLLCATAVAAHDFEVGGIYYNILSETDKTVEVTRGANLYTGSVVIPQTVTESSTNTFDAWTSTNKDNVSTSQTNYTLNVKAGDVLKFDWSVSSESNYDWLTITLDGTEIVRKSGVLSGSYEKTFDTAGSHTLVVKYTKDSSQSSGNDEGKIYNITLGSVGSVNDVVYRVTSIGEDAFGYCTSLTSITIPNSVTSIGRYAFFRCWGLTSITIPNSVTTIGEGAFIDCWGLTSITIPNSVTTIGESTFAGCSSLTSIEIPNSVTSIGYNAFSNCSGLTSITIPNSVTSIGIQAFSYCSGLTSVEIPNSVTSIANGAFSGCGGLTSITIPNSVTSIGSSAFSGCRGLTSIIVESGNMYYDSRDNCNAIIETATNKLLAGCKNTIIPNSVTSIGDGVFAYCTGLTSIEIPGSVTSIGDGAFADCTGLTSIEIPGCVTIIGNYAFEHCERLASITIPNSVTSIGYYAFSGCSGLTSVVIPNSVTSIVGGAFYNCSGLTSIEIPNSVTSIGDYAFYGCSGLTSIEIPASVTWIGDYVFYNCTGLTSITSLISAEELFSINSNVFNYVDKTTCTLYVPYGAKETYASTWGWNKFVNIVELEKPVTEVTVTIGQYGNATYCSPYALDFSEVEGLKAYAATGYKSNSQVVTLTRVQTSEAGIGLFLKGEPGEYVVPVIESTDEHSLNMLVGTLEPTIVNSTDGAMSNYKFTIAEGDASPMFYPFEDGTALSAGKAYLQIPTAWLPATAQKSLSVRFDDGETTDIDELKGEGGMGKTIYDLQGRVVENPTSGIYIIDGKKVLVK